LKTISLRKEAKFIGNKRDKLTTLEIDNQYNYDVLQTLNDITLSQIDLHFQL